MTGFFRTVDVNGDLRLFLAAANNQVETCRRLIVTDPDCVNVQIASDLYWHRRRPLTQSGDDRVRDSAAALSIKEVYLDPSPYGPETGGESGGGVLFPARSTPLHAAALFENIDVIDVLLTSGISLSGSNSTAYLVCYNKKYFNLLKYACQLPGVYVGQWQGLCRHGSGTYRETRPIAESVPDSLGSASLSLRRIEDEPKTSKPSADGPKERSKRDDAGVVIVEYQGQWARNRRHGVGTQRFADGSVYRGGWEDNTQHGLGKAIYASGRVYEGEWEGGVCQGDGIGTYADGTVYKGRWHQGLWEGYGSVTYPDKSYYYGYFRAGQRHGQGKVRYADGSRYVGRWDDNTKTSDGVHIFADGSTYRGEWRGDVPHGWGVQIYAPSVAASVSNSDSSSAKTDSSSDPTLLTMYQGYWVEGLPCRDSKISASSSMSSSSSSSSLPSDVVSDVPDERSVVRWYQGQCRPVDVSSILEARSRMAPAPEEAAGSANGPNPNRGGERVFSVKQLKDEEMESAGLGRAIKAGHGVQVYRNGDRYEGVFVDNEPTPVGVLMCQDGALYKGEFKHQVKHGFGEEVSHPSVPGVQGIYKGMFQYGRRHGHGICKWPDNVFTYREYSRGTLVSERTQDVGAEFLNTLQTISMEALAQKRSEGKAGVLDAGDDYKMLTYHTADVMQDVDAEAERKRRREEQIEEVLRKFADYDALIQQRRNESKDHRTVYHRFLHFNLGVSLYHPHYLQYRPVYANEGYSCDVCQKPTLCLHAFHCAVCENYDMCIDCYNASCPFPQVRSKKMDEDSIVGEDDKGKSVEDFEYDAVYGADGVYAPPVITEPMALLSDDSGGADNNNMRSKSKPALVSASAHRMFRIQSALHIHPLTYGAGRVRLASVPPSQAQSSGSDNTKDEDTNVGFACDVCMQNYPDTISYHCETCENASGDDASQQPGQDIDVCIDCVNKYAYSYAALPRPNSPSAVAPSSFVSQSVSASADADVRGIVHCPKLHEHRLVYLDDYEGEGFMCDECSIAYPGEKSYHCKICQFDYCYNCVQASLERSHQSRQQRLDAREAALREREADVESKRQEVDSRLAQLQTHQKQKQEQHEGLLSRLREMPTLAVPSNRPQERIQEDQNSGRADGDAAEESAPMSSQEPESRPVPPKILPYDHTLVHALSCNAHKLLSPSSSSLVSMSVRNRGGICVVCFVRYGMGVVDNARSTSAGAESGTKGSQWLLVGVSDFRGVDSQSALESNSLEFLSPFVLPYVAGPSQSSTSESALLVRFDVLSVTREEHYRIQELVDALQLHLQDLQSLYMNPTSLSSRDREESLLRQIEADMSASFALASVSSPAPSNISGALIGRAVLLLSDIPVYMQTQHHVSRRVMSSSGEAASEDAPIDRVRVVLADAQGVELPTFTPPLTTADSGSLFDRERQCTLYLTAQTFYNSVGNPRCYHVPIKPLQAGDGRSGAATPSSMSSPNLNYGSATDVDDNGTGTDGEGRGRLVQGRAKAEQVPEGSRQKTGGNNKAGPAGEETTFMHSGHKHPLVFGPMYGGIGFVCSVCKTMYQLDTSGTPVMGYRCVHSADENGEKPEGHFQVCEFDLCCPCVEQDFDHQQQHGVVVDSVVAGGSKSTQNMPTDKGPGRSTDANAVGNSVNQVGKNGEDDGEVI